MMIGMAKLINRDDFYVFLFWIFSQGLALSLNVQRPLAVDIKALLHNSLLFSFENSNIVDYVQPSTPGALRHRALVTTEEFCIILC